MRADRFRPAFVSDIPEELEPGVLYLALEYDAMAHLCACGCGKEVATPIGPTDWRIAWDGVGITVRPSVGNGSLDCRSHYVIDAGRTRWLPPMTDHEIVDERGRTARAKGLHEPPPLDRQPAEQMAIEPPPKAPWFVRLLNYLFGRTEA